MVKQHSPGFERLCEAARAKIKEVSAAEIHARIRAKERFLLLDIREDHEWTQGHFPTAEHLGRGILERDIEVKVPDPKTEIVLYCGGGYRAALAAESLQKMGYQNVKSIAGGYRGWLASGYEVTKDGT